MRINCPLDRFFLNPWHIAGSTLSRLIVNFATFTWAGIVLCKPNALAAAQSRYAFITDYAHEDVIAGFFIVLSLVNLFCLWKHTPPSFLKNLSYAILSFWWGFVFFSGVLCDGPIFPTFVAVSATLALVALYAFLDGKPERPKGD